MKAIRTRRRGTAIVEFAVVLPLLCLFVFGTIEVGYTFMVRQSLAMAAREGARLASLPNATVAEMQAGIDQVLAGPGLTGYTVSTNLDSISGSEPITWVEVSMPLDRVTFTGRLLGGGSAPLSSRVYAHREGVRSAS